MPKFELVPQEEAIRKTAAAGKRGQMLSLYLFFIDELKEGKAGKIQATEGESVQAVRRRLGSAAKLSGKNIAIKRVGDDIYFWLESESKPKRKRKSPTKRKSEATEDHTTRNQIRGGF